MSDFGVCDSGIARLFLTGPSILGSTDLIHTLEEVKGLGFDPSTSPFVVALVAKKGMSKKLWDEKVDAFKKWGWSDEDVLKAFRKKPQCMFGSIDKINLVMSFWVNQLGWDAMAIAKTPHILSLSLEKKIIPRAAVVQYLLSK
ncbi:mTERF protein, partial [Trifolium medium]|nr:mTERF protein [Trifolium medium]